MGKCERQAFYVDDEREKDEKKSRIFDGKSQNQKDLKKTSTKICSFSTSSYQTTIRIAFQKNFVMCHLYLLLFSFSFLHSVISKKSTFFLSLHNDDKSFKKSLSLLLLFSTYNHSICIYAIKLSELLFVLNYLSYLFCHFDIVDSFIFSSFHSSFNPLCVFFIFKLTREDFIENDMSRF
jgi:hypothetical protein